jgi:hypothetical protein
VSVFFAAPKAGNLPHETTFTARIVGSTDGPVDKNLIEERH